MAGKAQSKFHVDPHVFWNACRKSFVKPTGKSVSKLLQISLVNVSHFRNGHAMTLRMIGNVAHSLKIEPKSLVVKADQARFDREARSLEHVPADASKEPGTLATMISSDMDDLLRLYAETVVLQWRAACSAEDDGGKIDSKLWCIDGTIVRAHRCAGGGGKKTTRRNRLITH